MKKTKEDAEQLRPQVSVCMATFNGEQFISEQVASILAQLNAEDELIVVDDASTDLTVSKIESFGDLRIRIFTNGRNIGYVDSFQHAIELAANPNILLADQDDIWTEGRVDALINEMERRDSDAVLGRQETISFHGRSMRYPMNEIEVVGKISLIVCLVELLVGKSPIYGCCMGFRSELKAKVLPFPRGVECHDQWVAIVAMAGRGISTIDKTVTLRRIHERNSSTKKRSLVVKLNARAKLLMQMIIAFLMRR